MPVSIRIATLHGIFFEKDVHMAVIPAFDGEVGILPAHIPSVFRLESGLVKLHGDQSDRKEHIFIFGGFAKMSEDKLDIVTDQAIHAEDIDIKAIADKIKILETQIVSSGDEIFIESVQTELNLHRKMLEAASRVSH